MSSVPTLVLFLVSLLPTLQIEFVVDGSMPSDLSTALVLDRTELNRLQERVTQLHAEKGQQRDVSCQARQQHVRLIHDRKEMDTEIQSKTQTDTHLSLEEVKLPFSWTYNL